MSAFRVFSPSAFISPFQAKPRKPARPPADNSAVRPRLEDSFGLHLHRSLDATIEVVQEDLTSVPVQLLTFATGARPGPRMKDPTRPENETVVGAGFLEGCGP